MSEKPNENRLVLVGVIAAIAVALGAGFLISQNRAAAKERQAEKAAQFAGESGVLDYTDKMNLPVPEFDFESTAGRSIGRDDLLGHVWVAAFVLIKCPNNMCPDICRSLEQVQKATADIPDVRLVAFTVDPEVDTVEKLREYGKLYDADFDRWYFLRGEVDEVHAVAHEGFLLGSGKAVRDHSQKIVLVDADGKIRGFYDGPGDERVTSMRELELQIRELVDAGGR